MPESPAAISDLPRPRGWRGALRPESGCCARRWWRLCDAAQIRISAVSAMFESGRVVEVLQRGSRSACALRPFVGNGVVGLNCGKKNVDVAWAGTAEDSERLDLVCLARLVNLSTGLPIVPSQLSPAITVDRL